MTNKDLQLLKILAVGAMLVYVYRAKQRGLMLPGMNPNPDKIAGLAAQLVPHEYRKHAVKYGSAAIRRMFNS